MLQTCLLNWAAPETGDAGCHFSEELTKLESPGVSLKSSLLAVPEKHLTKLPIRVHTISGVVRTPSHIKDTSSGRRALKPTEPHPFFLLNLEIQAP